MHSSDESASRITEVVRLFAYGTLMPGYAPPAMRAIVAAARVVGRATMPGRLYHLGAYPGMAEDPGGVVHGVLLEWTHGAWEGRAVLEVLDEYEGCPDGVSSALFVRRLGTATLETGEAVSCWVYLYNRSTQHARWIESGRFA